MGTLAGRERAGITDIHRALPSSGALIDLFRDGTADAPSCEVLSAAAALVANHGSQWLEEDVSRSPGAADHEVAASKRRIDALNSRRVVLVERIDAWVEAHPAPAAGAVLHTETLGSVVDRLAIAWVRAHNLAADTAGDGGRALLAARQLEELAAAYDDLVRDVRAGRRRLPTWRPLKTYAAGRRSPRTA